MTTPEFATRLKAKMEATAEWWNKTAKVAESTAVQIALSEVADCIRHALKEPNPKRRKK